jgi:hypothetical protein
MRYHHSSWNDVDRALEAFRYARRSLLVVMALALPFAAWESAAGPKPGQAETVKVQQVEQMEQVAPVNAVRVLHAGGEENGCAGADAPAAAPVATFRT